MIILYLTFIAFIDDDYGHSHMKTFKHKVAEYKTQEQCEKAVQSSNLNAGSYQFFECDKE